MRASNEDKAAQIRTYTQYRTWAQASCNVSDGDLRRHLLTAAGLLQGQRGVDGIPKALRAKNVTVRQHAVLLCRVDGLRQAVSADLPGMPAWLVERAKSELERILSLTVAQLSKERGEVQPSLRSKLGFDLLSESPSASAWIPGLWRVWLHAEGARRMGAEEVWRQLMLATPCETLDAPTAFFLGQCYFRHRASRWVPFLPCETRGRASFWRVVAPYMGCYVQRGTATLR